jgi:hypothetical protein
MTNLTHILVTSFAVGDFWACTHSNVNRDGYAMSYSAAWKVCRRSSLVGGVCVCLTFAVFANLSRQFPNQSPWKSEIQLKNLWLSNHLKRDHENSILWESISCNSKHPIFRCTPRDNKTETFFTRFHSFKNIRYLKSTQHNTCSLVGSSGHMSNHAFGKHIDNTNIIIRINNPPVKGYE